MNHSARLVLAALALLTAPHLARAQVWTFIDGKDRPLFLPMLADPRAAMLKIAFPALSESVPYAVHDQPGLVWDITMGKELPFVSRRADDGGQGWVDRGHAGLGLWFPVGFHMIEDLKKDRSSPILNVDYRFGAMLKAQYGLPPFPKAERAVLGAQVYVGHESTHIGDEFTLNALRWHPATFRRVNVSYQFVELGTELGVDWPLAKARLQLRCLWVAFTHPRSWYSAELEYPDGGTVTPSDRNFEPSIGLEVTRKLTNWQPFLSVDLRPRTIYQYDRAAASDGEGFQWSVNGMLGVHTPRGAFTGLTQLYLRGYYGVNPAGQFRSQRDYWLVGAGAVFFQERN